MDADVRESLLRAGRISREVRERAVTLVKEGALLLDVAEEAEDVIRKRRANPALPTCISIDHIAAHYSPTHDDTTRFRHGNVVKLDLGAQLDGWIADTAVTVEVGTRNWTELVRASELALQTAIEAVHAGVSTRSIGEGIQRAIEAHGYRPVRNLTGHTIERYLLHAGKSVPNIAHGHDFREAGEVVAVEPVAPPGAGQVHGRVASRGCCSRYYRTAPSVPSHRSGLRLTDIKRIVLEVLKPHRPSLVEMSGRLSSLKGGDWVTCTLDEVDQETESVKVTIGGPSINYPSVEDALRELGAVIHSVDLVASGKRAVEDVRTGQDHR